MIDVGREEGLGYDYIVIVDVVAGPGSSNHHAAAVAVADFEGVVLVGAGFGVAAPATAWAPSAAPAVCGTPAALPS
jgi:hypothetical protein